MQTLAQINHFGFFVYWTLHLSQKIPEQNELRKEFLAQSPKIRRPRLFLLMVKELESENIFYKTIWHYILTLHSFIHSILFLLPTNNTIFIFVLLWLNHLELIVWYYGLVRCNSLLKMQTSVPWKIFESCTRKFKKIKSWRPIAWTYMLYDAHK